MKNLSPKLFIFVALALGACSGKSHGQQGSNSAQYAKYEAEQINNSYSAGACTVAKLDGSSVDISGPTKTAAAVTNVFDLKFFGKVDQPVYSVGDLSPAPNFVTPDPVQATSLETSLMKGGDSWKWVIGPKGEDEKNADHLVIAREIYDPNSSNTYVFEVRDIHYGQQFGFADELGGLYIVCSLPKQSQP